MFEKRPRHLVTYQSGDVTTQIDYILYRRSFRRHVTNVKVILGEECASQHRLVVGDFRLAIPYERKRKFAPRVKLWKLSDPAKQAELAEVFAAKVQGAVATSVEERWSTLRNGLKQAAEQVFGVIQEAPMEEADLVV